MTRLCGPPQDCIVKKDMISPLGIYISKVWSMIYILLVNRTAIFPAQKYRDNGGLPTCEDNLRARQDCDQALPPQPTTSTIRASLRRWLVSAGLAVRVRGPAWFKNHGSHSTLITDRGRTCLDSFCSYLICGKYYYLVSLVCCTKMSWNTIVELCWSIEGSVSCIIHIYI